MNLLQKIGWLLSYFQIAVLTPFGTCTQGDDSPWLASLFYAVVPLTGLVLIVVSSRKKWKSLMGTPHLLTLFLILWNLPSYWLRVTFQGQHICAGFEEELLDAFRPELWHRLWAPIVTFMGLLVVCIGYSQLKSYLKEYRMKE